jgi:two-component system OmpR family response regulator
MSKILIVEDESGVARMLKQATAEAGYAVQVVGDGPAALAEASTGQYDLILLDVMLPQLDGYAVCRQLRADRVTTPILMVTAKDLMEDKIAGLDAGADDYIVKPFHLGELLARMRALLRRKEYLPTPLRVADLILDPVTRRATRSGNPISLSTTEYTLLEYLMRHAGRILTRQEILLHVWQYDFGGHDNVLDVYISYLRGKIDRKHALKLIHNVRGVGFCMGEVGGCV